MNSKRKPSGYDDHDGYDDMKVIKLDDLMFDDLFAEDDGATGVTDDDTAEDGGATGLNLQNGSEVTAGEENVGACASSDDNIDMKVIKLDDLMFDDDGATGLNLHNGSEVTIGEENVGACASSDVSSILEDGLQGCEALTIIGGQYGIIKNIMSFLSMADLKKMSTVSQTWNAASRTEQHSFARTHSVETFSWEPKQNLLTEQKQWKEKLSILVDQKEVLSGGMARFSKHGLMESKVKAIESSPLQLDVQAQLEDKIENTMIEPCVAIVFSVGDIDPNFDVAGPNSTMVDAKAFHLNISQVEKILPRGCEIISTCSRGIVLPRSGLRNSVVKEIENLGTRVHPAVTAFLLPTFDYPKLSISYNCDRSNFKMVKIIPFDIPEYRNYVAEKTDILSAIDGQNQEDVEDPAVKDREIRRQLMKQVFCKNRLKDNDTIKCVIALSNVNQNPSLLKLFYAAAADWAPPTNLNSSVEQDPTIEHTLKPSIAIGGVVGKLCRYSSGTGPTSLKDMLGEYAKWEESNNDHNDDEDLLTDERAASYKRSVGLIFAGEGIQAASVILPPNIKNESRVMKELQKLKDCEGFDLDHPNSNSFAFMFACCGRGKHFHNDKSNVESKCFKALFPNTPLIGIFGEGEFGWNYLPRENNPPSKNTQKEKERHSNSRSFTRLKERDICHAYTTVFVVLSINTGNTEEDAKVASSIFQFANSSTFIM